MIDFETVLGDANALYADVKLAKLGYPDIRYLAPEQIPTIQSDQVLAILQALVTAINDEKKLPQETVRQIESRFSAYELGRRIMEAADRLGRELTSAEIAFLQSTPK